MKTLIEEKRRFRKYTLEEKDGWRCRVRVKANTKSNDLWTVFYIEGATLELKLNKDDQILIIKYKIRSTACCVSKYKVKNPNNLVIPMKIVRSAIRAVRKREKTIGYDHAGYDLILTYAGMDSKSAHLPLFAPHNGSCKRKDEWN